MVATPIKYKDNLFERIGGVCNVDFLIISYCERIQDDKSLSRFYGNFDMKSLIALEKELVMAAIIEPSSKSEASNILSRVALRHYQLFEQGLNQTHFDALANHFSGGLRDCWLADDVVADCEKYFGGLRSLFEEHGKSATRSVARSQNANERLSLSMRESINVRENMAMLKDLDRLCRSEEYKMPSSTTDASANTPKPRSFLQKLVRRV
eukprot:scaffold2986_cov82-Cylindrotheca_fusiformis.AAC.2